MPILFIVTATINGFQKDKLNDELEPYKGKYSWIEYRFRQNWWDSGLTSRPASNYDFKAEIEFDNKGKIKFFIDGEEIHKTGYSIVEHYVMDDGQTIFLSVKPRIEDTKEIDLNNTMEFWLRNDSLVVDDFPGESYDGNLRGEHLFQRN